MVVEFLKKRIGRRVDEIRQQRKPFASEDIADLLTVKSRVVFGLSEIFNEGVGGADYEEKQGQNGPSEAFSRLRVKYGRERIFDCITADAKPNLKEDVVLFNQYKAAIRGILDGL